jgi:ABC-type lipoprotein export system ATPase subunit
MSAATTPEAIPTRSATALRMDDVDVSFPRPGQTPLVIVTDFQLCLPAGQLHCLAGRSGSGKTSLLRVAVALAAPAKGSVYWHGRRVDDLTGDELAGARRGHMSYVDQGATVIEQLTVLDNVLLPAVPDGIDRAAEDRARELLELFGLQPRTSAAAGTLSGGERQRLALARALLLRPGLIAVDEPTASLDRATADLVIDALRLVVAEGAAVLAASHDQGLIDVADTTTRLD